MTTPASRNPDALGLWMQQSLLTDEIQCVTLQLNATLYTGPGTVRETVILRDAMANVELARGIAVVQDYATWVVAHDQRWVKVIELADSLMAPFGHERSPRASRRRPRPTQAP